MKIRRGHLIWKNPASNTKLIGRNKKKGSNLPFLIANDLVSRFQSFRDGRFVGSKSGIYLFELECITNGGLIRLAELMVIMENGKCKGVLLNGGELWAQGFYGYPDYTKW